LSTASNPDVVVTANSDAQRYEGHLDAQHAGFSALWQVFPTLLVPLGAKQEAARVALATDPHLDSPSLRMIGRKAALGQLARVLGELSVPGKRQDRLVDCRNGSLHVGTQAPGNSARNSTVWIDARLVSGHGLPVQSRTRRAIAKLPFRPSP
jgi:hypothetical protein